MNIRNRTYCVSDIYRLDSIPYTGYGSCAAILDTGIYPHPDLADHIAHFEDFINGKKHAYDDNSHGTHVAGIIAGNGFSQFLHLLFLQSMMNDVEFIIPPRIGMHAKGAYRHGQRDEPGGSDGEHDGNGRFRHAG